MITGDIVELVIDGCTVKARVHADTHNLGLTMVEPFAGLRAGCLHIAGFCWRPENSFVLGDALTRRGIETAEQMLTEFYRDEVKRRNPSYLVEQYGVSLKGLQLAFRVARAAVDDKAHWLSHKAYLDAAGVLKEARRVGRLAPRDGEAAVRALQARLGTVGDEQFKEEVRKVRKEFREGRLTGKEHMRERRLLDRRRGNDYLQRLLVEECLKGETATVFGMTEEDFRAYWPLVSSDSQQ